MRINRCLAPILFFVFALNAGAQTYPTKPIRFMVGVPPGGPTDTPGFFPPGMPRPHILLDPEIMRVPVVWLASPQSDGITGSRFIARDWDLSLPPAEAAARVRAPAAWPTLAQAAAAARGHAM